MKKFIQFLLQKILGFKTYLFLFAIVKSIQIKYDKKESDFIFLFNFIKKDSNVLDIGANVGIMTSNLARHNPLGIVYAFEPINENFDTLKKVIRFFKLKNVQFFNFALGDESKEIEMVLPIVDNVKMQGLSHVIDSEIVEFNEGEKYKVKQERTDELQILRNIKIDAIKIDVENFEYKVFLGARETIIKNKPIIYCELWDNENRKQCFDFFLQINYQIKIVKNNKLIDFNNDVHKTQNFYFIPIS